MNLDESKDHGAYCMFRGLPLRRATGPLSICSPSAFSANSLGTIHIAWLRLNYTVAGPLRLCRSGRLRISRILAPLAQPRPGGCSPDIVCSCWSLLPPSPPYGALSPPGPSFRVQREYPFSYLILLLTSTAFKVPPPRFISA
jgi:hypothetical protein